MMRRATWIGALAGAFIAVSPAACGGKEDPPASKTPAEPAPRAQPREPAARSPAPGDKKPAETAPAPGAPGELKADPGGHQGKAVWARRIGSLGKDTARDVAADGSGNIAVTGYFSDGADLGDGNPTAAQKVDAYVAKYGPAGEHLWTVHFGGKGEDIGNAVTFDAAGNVIVTGLFSDTVTVGDTALTSAGSDDAFIVKLNPDGAVLWARKLGGLDSDAAYDVAASPSSLVVTGSFKGSIKAADVTLASAGNEDIFVVALDAHGDLQWIKQFGHRYKDYGQQVAIDGRGHIILLSEFSSQIGFGGATLESQGNRDLAVVKLDPGGGHVWSRRFGSVFDELGLGLAVDPAGNIAFTGSFDNDIHFGGAKLSSRGESDVFVVKLDPAGNHLWSTSYGSARPDLGTGIAADMYGNVAVGGWFWHTVDFGGGPLEAPNGNKDAFLLKLSANGEHLWSRRLGDRDHDQLRGVAIAKDGRVAACGIFRFQLETGTETLEAARKPEDKAPHPDAFVAVFGR